MSSKQKIECIDLTLDDSSSEEERQDEETIRFVDEHGARAQHSSLPPFALRADSVWLCFHLHGRWETVFRTFGLPVPERPGRKKVVNKESGSNKEAEGGVDVSTRFVDVFFSLCFLPR